MKVISVNLNGIRSAWKKGFQEWLKKQDADVTCLQEIRIQENQLTEEMRNPEFFWLLFQFFRSICLWAMFQSPHMM